MECCIMNKKNFSRRDFLKLAGLATAGTVSACQFSRVAVDATPTAPPGPTYGLISTFPPSNPPMHTATSQPTASPTGTAEPTATTPPTETPIPERTKTRVLRIAHMTDFHVQPEGISADGMVRALRHVQSQADPPNIIFNTGDSIMDSMWVERHKAEQQWDFYNSILAAENRIPVVHAIGNHDVWGWGLSDPSLLNDPMYGKELAIARLGLPYRYYSFDYAGWHFIVLDSTHLTSPAASPPFLGRLDEEQYEWFLSDVNAVSMTTNAPICILSHIPIMAGCGVFSVANAEATGSWVVPGNMVHIDARRFRDYFVQSPRIRLCLSGHTHQYESLEYLGVRYITGGAVSGGWWNGIYMNFPPAYVMVNLYDDGSSDSEFVPYDETLGVDKTIRYFLLGALH
jgi:hypothetical protein